MGNEDPLVVIIKLRPVTDCGKLRSTAVGTGVIHQVVLGRDGEVRNTRGMDRGRKWIGRVWLCHVDETRISASRGLSEWV